MATGAQGASGGRAEAPASAPASHRPYGAGVSAGEDGAAGGYLVVTTTLSSPEAAGALARRLVERRLAACVQSLRIDSVYRWEGEVVEEPEVLLVAKTRRELYDELEQAVRAEHPYEVPEIVAVGLERGLPAYLSWIDEATGGGPAPGPSGPRA